jgi:hypothetical protein
MDLRADVRLNLPLGLILLLEIRLGLALLARGCEAKRSRRPLKKPVQRNEKRGRWPPFRAPCGSDSLYLSAGAFTNPMNGRGRRSDMRCDGQTIGTSE